MVPTIFPPSAVNRGESVHVGPVEAERRPRPTPSAAPTVHQSAQSPKKRGRKPKPPLPYDNDEGGCSAEPYAKQSRLQHHHHHHPHHGETSDHSLIQLTKRFQEETTITPRCCSEHGLAGGAGLPYSDGRKGEKHRTGYGMSVPQPRKQERPEEHPWHQERECAPGPADVTMRSWTPCFTSADTVTVTDITMNLLTVTVKENSTDKGFFRQNT